MKRLLPGTTLTLPPGKAPRPFSLLEPIFAVSGGGLLLSQIVELTGLPGATIQNWVKRGWVPSPVNKRYKEQQVARILLINLLRPAMKLENIATLLAYVNGRVDDRSDDIIPDPELYNRLCSAVILLQERDTVSHESVTTLIDAQLEGYEGPVPGARDRLFHALTIMLLNVAAASLMSRADELMEREVLPPKEP